MQIEVKTFSELTINALYDILKLRCDVFVVEQECAYPELDEKDRHPETLHVSLLDDSGELIGYNRIVPPALSYPEPSIGRVVVISSHRGKGLAAQVVKASIEVIHKQWPQRAIKIGAQEYLLRFYQSLGFQNNSDMYLEDGIPHRDMILPYPNFHQKQYDGSNDRPA
ncbi:GNAT family N-acetyltransferase [Sansalvadorimonas verongulae]|uniref:GNAT family N-acetyltransferase n=1 Tax=Sansalvadorimonas verongulae TaxID=2172824 RepID=UPI0012BB6EC9|nr:GNAT family N-acetyltransferase [Sansalvadorimonas verongulae]MTI12294.1 GNAT family N-acetyltransferase [Sansalvadorimonas verongulae]